MSRSDVLDGNNVPWVAGSETPTIDFSSLVGEIEPGLRGVLNRERYRWRRRCEKCPHCTASTQAGSIPTSWCVVRIQKTILGWMRLRDAEVAATDPGYTCATVHATVLTKLGTNGTGLSAAESSGITKVVLWWIWDAAREYLMMHSTPAEQRRLLPQLSYTRFQIAKDLGDEGSWVWGTVGTGEKSRTFADVIFGDEPSGVDAKAVHKARLLREARVRRAEWLDYLLAYQSYPSLSILTGEDVERLALDAVMVKVTTMPDGAASDDEAGGGNDERERDAGRAPSIRKRRSTETKLVTLGDPVEASWTALRVSEEILLPHFERCKNWRLGQAVKVALADTGRGKAIRSRLWWGQWHLRWVGASLIGSALLLELGAWWRLGLWTALVLGGVLLLPTWGYLWLQQRAAGMTKKAPRRSFAELVHGFVVALMVATVVLLVLSPVFADGFPFQWGIGTTEEAVSFSTWWSTQSMSGGIHAITECVTRAARLFFAASWAVMSGVFLQALWDHVPISAPLNHRRWESHDQRPN